MQNKSQVLAIFLLALSCSAASAETTPLIRIKGSDTMVYVAQTWAEEYRHQMRDVAVSVGGGGSGTGFHAMLIGTADLVNASRRISKKETERATDLGMDPVEHVVGFDALALYLHKDNPIDSVSFAQLAQIFGRNGTIEKWSDLGIEVPGCKGQEIVRVGRQASSGTYVYFRSAVLQGQGRYDMGILDMISSKDVVQMVERTPCAIGYSGLAYATPNVKMACVKKDETSACVLPSIASASDKSYPIARPLFVYAKNQPSGEIKSYLDWILSDKGQCIVQRKGYAPVRPLDCN